MEVVPPMADGGRIHAGGPCILQGGRPSRDVDSDSSRFVGFESSEVSDVARRGHQKVPQVRTTVALWRNVEREAE